MSYPLGTVVQGSTSWTETITSTGTWTAPTDGTNGFHIASMSIEVIGGGGSGGATSGVGGTTPGAGGGGGAYSKLNSFSPTAGTNYTATVGAVAGDSWFSTTGTVLAKGGTTASTTTAGTGGAAASGVGDTKFSGGAGGAGSGVTGGGGGGGAGSTGNGNPASTTTAGAAKTVGGGAGGAAGAGGSVQGGAGGGASALGSAGGGARGYIVLTYNKVYASNPTESVGAPTDAVTRSTTVRRSVLEGDGGTTSAYATTILADSPALYWKLNESGAASSTYADSTGNGNTGHQYLVPAQSVSGAIINSTDTGVHLSGDLNSLIYANSYNPWVAGAVRTYEMWLWLDRSQIQNYPMSFSGGHGAGLDSAYSFWGTGGASGFATLSVNFSPAGNQAGRTIQTWNNAIPAGPNGDSTDQWVHQVIVHDDTAKTATLYINGVSQGQKTGLNALVSNDILRLAHWFENSIIFGKWQGKYDEVAVYESALTATQIKNHYLAGIANQVTDSVSRQYAANRTLSESISAPTDAVSRTFIGSRTLTENVAAPTDSVGRLTVTNRTITENVTAPADSVARVLQSNRTITENIDAPTDSVSRTASFNRTQTENVDAPTDVLSRQTNLGRTITENVDAPIDVVARHASFSRNPTEVLPGAGGGTTIVKRPTYIFDD